MLFLGDGTSLHLDGGKALQFQNSLMSHHRHVVIHEFLIGVAELPGVVYPILDEELLILTPYPPHLAYRSFLQGFGDPVFIHQRQRTFETGNPFGPVICHLGQGLGSGDSHRNGDASPLDDGLADFASVFFQVFEPQAGQHQEGLVDRVNLHFRSEVRQGLHHAGGHIT